MSDYIRKKCPTCQARKSIHKSYTECLNCRTHERVDPKKMALYLHGLNKTGFMAWLTA